MKDLLGFEKLKKCSTKEQTKNKILDCNNYIL